MLTKNFIKQCEKAEEIQKAWIPLIGDWVVAPIIPLPMVIRYKKTINQMNKDEYIWLPTQEQLQEMVLNQYTPFARVMKFSEFVLYRSGLNPYVKNSINELWLMYVMKEKYNKIWNGEDWVTND